MSLYEPQTLILVYYLCFVAVDLFLLCTQNSHLISLCQTLNISSSDSQTHKLWFIWKPQWFRNTHTHLLVILCVSSVLSHPEVHEMFPSILSSYVMSDIPVLLHSFWVCDQSVSQPLNVKVSWIMNHAGGVLYNVFSLLQNLSKNKKTNQ